MVASRLRGDFVGGELTVKLFTGYITVIIMPRVDDSVL